MRLAGACQASSPREHLLAGCPLARSSADELIKNIPKFRVRLCDLSKLSGAKPSAAAQVHTNIFWPGEREKEVAREMVQTGRVQLPIGTEIESGVESEVRGN